MKNLLIVTLAALVFVGFAASITSARDYGPFILGTPVVGSTQDSVLIPDLHYWTGGGSVVGKYLYVASTTDLAAPMNEVMYIEGHTQTTNLLWLDTASSSSAGPSAVWTAGDVVWVMDAPPAGAQLRAILTATKVGSGVAPLNYFLDMLNQIQSSGHGYIGVASMGTGANQVDGIDSIYITSLSTLTDNRFNGGGWRLRVLYDAGGAHAVPETQYRDITSVTYTSGLIVCSAFANAIGAGDILLIYDGTEEVLLETNDTSLDSLIGAFYGAVGLQWSASAAPANGVSISEVIRKIYDLGAANAGVNDLDTLVVYVNLVSADSVWNTVGENEVITMPDGVSIEGWLTVRDSIAVGGADSISVCMGDGTSALLTKVRKSDLAAGEYITYAPGSLGTYRVENPTVAGFNVIGDGMAGTAMFHFISNGADIGYNVQTATPITTGYLIYTLVYRTRSGVGAPSAGLGGDL